MAKHVIDFCTVELTKGPRSVKAKLYYEGGPYPGLDVPPLHELSAKDEKAALAKAREWLAKRTVKKLLGNCAVCRNGVELHQGEVKDAPYKFQLHCQACGVVLYRGNAKLVWPG